MLSRFFTDITHSDPLLGLVVFPTTKMFDLLVHDIYYRSI